MLPTPPPISNEAVTGLVRRIRSAAKTRIIGKTEAVDSPSAMVPIHYIVDGVGKSITSPKLERQPSRSIKRIVQELKRLAMPEANNLPSVREPQ